MNLDIRRGDFVLMLYRTAGEPAVQEEIPFSDVPSGMYYADAITWAASQKIALGDGKGFSPDAPLTREQSFALMYRYLMTVPEQAADDTLASPDLSVLESFRDYENLSEYAEIPAAALVGNAIIGGADGKLMPADHLTRGQMARILSSALEYIENTNH